MIACHIHTLNMKTYYVNVSYNVYVQSESREEAEEQAIIQALEESGWTSQALEIYDEEGKTIWDITTND